MTAVMRYGYTSRMPKPSDPTPYSLCIDTNSDRLCDILPIEFQIQPSLADLITKTS